MSNNFHGTRRDSVPSFIERLGQTVHLSPDVRRSAQALREALDELLRLGDAPHEANSFEDLELPAQVLTMPGDLWVTANPSEG